MTKFRNPESIHYAVLRCLGQLGPAAEEVVGKSMSYLRQCSDPDSRMRISVEDATALDAAMRRRGHGTPIFEAYAAALALVPSAAAEQSLQTGLVDLVAKVGRLAQDTSDAMADGILDLNERRALTEDAHRIKDQAVRIMEIVEPPAPEPLAAAGDRRRSA